MVGSFFLPASTGTDLVPDWVRPEDWLEIPEITSGEQVMYLLMGVPDNEATFIAFAVTVTGGYSVNWGDGSSVENVSSGVKGEHSYAFSALSSSTEVDVDSITYRQALITIRPQVTANTITTISFQQRHSSLPTSGDEHYSVLEFNINLSGLTTITLGSFSGIIYSTCKNVNITEIGLNTILSNLCRSFFSLERISLFPTNSTAFNNAFTECYRLKKIPDFNFSATTTLSSIFNNCQMLVKSPIINTTNVLTSIGGMYGNCYSLEEIPLFYTENVTNYTNFAVNCFNITTLPAFNLSAGTATGPLVQFAPNLTSVGDIIFPSNPVITFTSLVNLIDISNLDFKLPREVNLNSNTNLTKIPIINGTNLTTLSSSFSNNKRLREIEIFNLSGFTGSTSQTFLSCNSLEKLTMSGMTRGFDITNCNLGPNALNDLFTSLGTASGSQTIVITGNWGSATCDTSIATSKGWTITP